MIIFAAGICQKSGAAEICRANAAAEICRKKQRLRYIVVMILATGICPKIAAAEICQAHVAAEICRKKKTVSQFIFGPQTSHTIMCWPQTSHTIMLVSTGLMDGKQLGRRRQGMRWHPLLLGRKIVT